MLNGSLFDHKTGTAGCCAACSVTESYFVPEAMAMRKIIVTGPESSGKTTLARMLAAYYQAPLVDEQARAYLNELGRPYVEADLLAIAGRQWAAEQQAVAIAAEASSAMIVGDTDLITLRIWAVEKYGRCDPWIVKMTQEQRGDHYLLCTPDMPWEPDPQRENPNDRDRLFALYERELNALGRSFTIIKGDREERMRLAVTSIDELISPSSSDAS